VDTRGKVDGDRYRGGTAGIKIRVIRVWGPIVRRVVAQPARRLHYPTVYYPFIVVVVSYPRDTHGSRCETYREE